MIPQTEHLYQAAALLLGWVGEALILGTILAGLTWVVVRISRGRLSPGLEVILWGIVLVKFLVPLGPGWCYSFPSVCNKIYQIGAVSGVVGNELNADLDQARLMTGAEGMAAVQGSQPMDLFWPAALATAYLASVTLLLAWRIRRHNRFKNRCLSLPEADETIMEVVRAVCRRLGVRRVPSVRISRESPAPFIVGFIHPLLILSRKQLVRPNELETVVVHEVTHLRRGDIWLRLLQWTAGILLFFWPVVAWVNRRIDMVREHACDQWALRHGKLSACEYARCLLSAVPTARLRRMAYRPTCMAGRISTIERRIDMILKPSVLAAKGPVWKIAGLVFLMGWSVFVFTGAGGVRDGIAGEECLSDALIKEHAKQIVSRIGQYASADVDGDGEIGFEERNAFLMALFLMDSDRSLNHFPYADSFKGRDLEVMDVYDVVRGLSYRKGFKSDVTRKVEEAKARGTSDDEIKKLVNKAEQQNYQAVEVVLDAQDSLLDSLVREPDADKVAAVHAKISKHEMKDKRAKLKKEAVLIQEKIEKLEAMGNTEKAEAMREKLHKIKQALASMEQK